MLWSSSSAISSSNARSRSLCSTEGSLASLGFSCWSVSSFLFCWPLSAGLKLTKKDWVSQKLSTYPCPKPTLTLTPCLGQNVGLGEGWVSSFPETGNPKSKKNTFAKLQIIFASLPMHKMLLLSYKDDIRKTLHQGALNIINIVLVIFAGISWLEENSRFEKKKRTRWFQVSIYVHHGKRRQETISMPKCSPT